MTDQKSSLDLLPTETASTQARNRLDADTKGRFVGLLGLGLLSLWLVLHLSSNFYFSIASKHWPLATARILSSGVYASGAGAGATFTPQVKYQFEADGKSYQSNNIRYLLKTFYNADTASEVESPYPVGRVVEVAFNPQDPSESVLEPGVPKGMWTQALIPLFFFGLCGYIFFEITHPHRRVLLGTYTVRDTEDEDSGSEAEPA
ncbi:MAG TPA: DUF3592 domain-containing protein [Terriglobales bacterium]|nr:DUF3592 domain-containing protein [Terriglobales bacterium]